MELIVRDVVYPGKALCKDDSGKAIFVDEGIDGEAIEAELVHRHKSYDEARLLRVLRPSPHRVKPKCLHYRICSNYQVIDYPYQVRLKLRQLAGILKGIYSQRIFSEPASAIFHYRNKAVFHIDCDGNRFGYRDLDGRVVDVETCALLRDEINEKFARIREVMQEKGPMDFERIGFRVNRDGEVLLILYLKEGQELSDDEVGWFSGLGFAGVVRIKGLSVRPLAGRDWLEEEILGRRFRYYGDGFFQVNTEMAERLVSLLRQEAMRVDARVVLDLFCGVGLLGLSLSDMVRWVYGVEQAPICKKALDVNSDYNTFGNFSFKLGSAGSVAWEVFEDRHMRAKIDTVIVDPPRKGLSRSVREFLRKNGKIRNLFYVSCDPMTLRRDLLELKAVYKIDKVFFLDFFPNTGHIETLTVMRRRRKG